MTASTETRASTTTEPGGRRKGESAKAFAAWVIYRDMGAGTRSTAKVAAEYGRTPSLIERWCTRWRWVARAAEWDGELDHQVQLAQIEAHKEMAARHAATAKLALNRAIERLAAFTKDDPVPASILPSLLRVGVDVERQAMGEPSVVERRDQRIWIEEEERPPMSAAEMMRRLQLRAEDEAWAEDEAREQRAQRD